VNYSQSYYYGPSHTRYSARTTANIAIIKRTTANEPKALKLAG
jgi:hypothetical protein